MNKSTLFTLVAAMAAASVLSGCAKQKDEKVQLWKGGPYWATKNIGAEEPWDYGLYFWWGDTVGYRRVGDAWVASDGSSSNFSFSEDNTPICYKGHSILRSEGWTITKDGMDVLAPARDAANVHWGENWRMPTEDELSALEFECDWTRTVTNGVFGYVVSGRGDYASSSIFLPAAGFGHEASRSHADSEGFYWSSVPVPYGCEGAIALHFLRTTLFTFQSVSQVGYNNYGDGLPVRPVQGIAK